MNRIECDKNGGIYTCITKQSHASIMCKKDRITWETYDVNIVSDRITIEIGHIENSRLIGKKLFREGAFDEEVSVSFVDKIKLRVSNRTTLVGFVFLRAEDGSPDCEVIEGDSVWVAHETCCGLRSFQSLYSAKLCVSFSTYSRVRCKYERWNYRREEVS